MKIVIFFLCFLLSSLSVNAVSPFNPDISLVGEFNILKDSASGQYLPGIGEFEVGMTSAIDPYSTATLILSHSTSGTEIEEGFIKISSLPFDLQAKLGRMRVDFNHLNKFHGHALPFIELPKYIQEFFGDEGLVKNGVEVSYLLPLGFYSELKALWLNGDADNSFAASYGIAGFKWKNFFETNENSGLEFSFSRLQGTNASGLTPTDNFKTEITGLHLRYKQGLGPEQYLIVNNEWLLSHSDFGSFVDTNGRFHYLGYQLNSFWQLGVGSNFSQNPDGTTQTSDWFLSAHYKWSEFQNYRLRYSKDEGTGDHILFTLNFILGPHPAHEF